MWEKLIKITGKKISYPLLFKSIFLKTVDKKFKIDIIFNSSVFCNEFRFLSLLLNLEK